MISIWCKKKESLEKFMNNNSMIFEFIKSDILLMMPLEKLLIKFLKCSEVLTHEVHESVLKQKRVKEILVIISKGFSFQSMMICLSLVFQE